MHWVSEGQPFEPRTASLSLERFTTDAESIPESYQNLKHLVVDLKNLFKTSAEPSSQVQQQDTSCALDGQECSNEAHAAEPGVACTRFVLFQDNHAQ